MAPISPRLVTGMIFFVKDQTAHVSISKDSGYAPEKVQSGC